ncbi:MAG: hypothetical protein II901_02125 [Paludibacteraceae bacterium]|nr:hypothetical protein [Paludibacteraceae bacterium]
MARHLKSIVEKGLKGYIGHFVPNSEISASHARGVRYFVPITAINMFCGAMNSVKEGAHYQKHIIVRRTPRHRGVLQLYTYHFPKSWSAACVANREIIKEAQRRTHALERTHSYASIEWHIRFLKHYFRVFKCGEKPEPGMKRYSRFYQYTYVAIFRELKAAAQQAEQELEVNVENLSVEPVVHARVHLRNSASFNRIANNISNAFTPLTSSLPPPEVRFSNSHARPVTLIANN